MVRVKSLDSLQQTTLNLLEKCRHITIVGPAMSKTPPFHALITDTKTINRYTNTPGGTRPTLLDYGTPENSELKSIEDRYLSLSAKP